VIRVVFGRRVAQTGRFACGQRLAAAGKDN
jgi:hypothetical protein